MVQEPLGSAQERVFLSGRAFQLTNLVVPPPVRYWVSSPVLLETSIVYPPLGRSPPPGRPAAGGFKHVTSTSLQRTSFKAKSCAAHEVRSLRAGDPADLDLKDPVRELRGRQR